MNYRSSCNVGGEVGEQNDYLDLSFLKDIDLSVGPIVAVGPSVVAVVLGLVPVAFAK